MSPCISSSRDFAGAKDHQHRTQILTSERRKIERLKNAKERIDTKSNARSSPRHTKRDTAPTTRRPPLPSHTRLHCAVLRGHGICNAELSGEARTMCVVLEHTSKLILCTLCSCASPHTSHSSPPPPHLRKRMRKNDCQYDHWEGVLQETLGVREERWRTGGPT